MNPSSNASPSRAHRWRAWTAVAAATLCAFSSFLNITVTNTSLPQIQAAIGASGSEGTWVGTAYLAAEVVMIPLTAWLNRLLGLRLFLVIATVVFAIFSVLCAAATDLTSMILARAGQGFAGGALIPAGLTIVATRLTPAERPLGVSVYATMSVLAPMIGPPLGGWLTETLGWRWSFFLNLPFAAVAIALTVISLDRQPIHKEELAKADWVGIAGLSLALGCLIVVLEQGQKENWFDSDFILRLAGLSLVGVALLVYSQFTHRHPILKLKLFRVRSFSAVVACALVIGGASFVVIYLVPTFLALVAGYDAEQTGWVAGWSGITSFLFMPLFGYLLTRIDIRWMIVSGFLLYALGTLLDTRITGATVGAAFLLSQLIRGGAQMAATLPLSQATTTGLAPEDIADGAAMFTVARNFGGSVGLALTGIFIERQTTYHAAQIGAAHTANAWVGNESLVRLLVAIGNRQPDAAANQARALTLMGTELRRQALVLAYIDAFWCVAVILVLAVPLIFFIRQAAARAQTVAH